MSIEQTSQLLHLLFNGLVLSLICALTVLMSAVRSQMISIQLQTLDNAAQQDEVPSRDRREQWSHQRRSLRREYRLERLGQIASHQAFAIAILSVLVVSLRSLVNWNGLIEISLICFVGSLALLWFSVMCILINVYRGSLHIQVRREMRQSGASPNRDHKMQRSPSMPIELHAVRRRHRRII